MKFFDWIPTKKNTTPTSREFYWNNNTHKEKPPPLLKYIAFDKIRVIVV